MDVPTSRCTYAPKCWSVDMTTRSRRETVHFQHPFRIKGIDRLLAPGAYEVITDEEMIEGLSFPSFRRVATMIMGVGCGKSYSISNPRLIFIRNKPPRSGSADGYEAVSIQAGAALFGQIRT
jgi:hypothetical protein